MKETDYEQHLLKIGPELENQRLDIAILQHEKISSRSNARKLFKNNLILVNGKIAKPSYLTQLSDEVVLNLPIAEVHSDDLKPYNFPLDIVFEDEHLLVVNKPHGLVMHPSVGHTQDSLVNALIAKNISLSDSANKLRPGIVHRIDKDTSGLVVVAKNTSVHQKLAEQFKDKSIHRVYQAITFGYFKNKSGHFENHLVRHPRDRKKYSIERVNEGDTAKGKWAVTHYKVLAEFKGLSLVQCQLETGRTHQIRVHLTENNHPIINDPIYSTSRRLNNIQSKHVKDGIKSLNCMGLLAKELGFKHPVTGEEHLFKCTWPKDMDSLLKFLKWDELCR